jgi:hypothetical protein
MKTFISAAGLMAASACTATLPETPGEPLPQTCRHIVDADRDAADGEYLLYLDGEADRPWEAYCHDLAGQPREFLTLRAEGEHRNQSVLHVFERGGYSAVITRYHKVRIDPRSLDVDIGDQTFADSEGGARAGDTSVRSMPFGVAAACTWTTDVALSSRASVDFSGTAFVIDSSFCMRDAAPALSSIWSTAQSRIELLVAPEQPGVCASASVAPCPGGLYNEAGGFQLRLSYRP